MSITKNQWELRPTSSALSLKYWRSSRVTVGTRTITPGLFSSMDVPNPTYLPESWSVHTHPEGNRYFVRSTCPKIITEANLYDADILQRVIEALEVVVAKLAEYQSAISEATELYLDLEDEYSCSYYLVDHALRAQFWLEEVSSDELGARNCASDDHLRIELERFYWIHVEYFCGHNSTGLNLAVDNLIDVMTQGRTDQLTSTTSTFPYSADECGQFIQCLENVRTSSDCLSAFSKWTAARMWQNITDVRFLTHYGQEYARVASNVSILDIDVPEETLLFKCCDFLGFNTPQTYLQQLNLQWTDEVAHALRWKTFVTACHGEWKMSLLLSFAMLICNLLLVDSPIASSVPVAVAAILLCNASVVVAVALLLQHGPMGGKQLAEDLSEYLQAANSKHFGLQLTAISFSMPRVLTLWALIVSSMQVVVVTLGLHLASICTGAAVGIFLLVSVVCKLATTVYSLLDSSTFYHRFRPFFVRSRLQPSVV